MADALGDERLVLGAPVRRIEHGAGRRHRARRRRRGARPARDRRDGAHARRRGSPTTRRCPATATSSPSGCRSARSSSAWRSTTSRSGAPTACPARPPATAGPCGSPSTTRRRTARPGVLLGFLEGRRARELGRAARRRAPDRGDRLLRASVRPARGHTRRTTSSGSGRRRSGRAAATAATCPPASGPATARRCAQPIGPLHWAGAEYAHGLERLHGRRGALGRGDGRRGLEAALSRASTPSKPPAPHVKRRLRCPHRSSSGVQRVSPK